MQRSHPGRHGVLNVIVSAGVAMSLSAWGPDAAAQTRVTYKSAKTGSSYYQMGVEIAQAMKAGTDGRIIVTVEESQGSVQNVMEAATRSGNYVFTTPPSLVVAAQEGKGPFKDKTNPKFADIRALLPPAPPVVPTVTPWPVSGSSAFSLALMPSLVWTSAYTAKSFCVL